MQSYTTPQNDSQNLTQNAGVVLQSPPVKKSSSPMSLVLVVLGLLVLAAVGVAGGYYYGQQQSGTNNASQTPDLQEAMPGSGSGLEQTLCTMDAMMCPDGSSVGRSGPNCEFDVCPGSEATDLSETLDLTMPAEEATMGGSTYEPEDMIAR